MEDMTNPSAPYPAMSPDDSRTAAILAHLAGPIAAVISAGWLSIVGPLVIWLINKDRDAFVRQQAANAFNFQLSMWLVSIVGGLLLVTIILIPVGVILMIVALLASVISGILAAVAISKGQPYNYPWKITVLS